MRDDCRELQFGVHIEKSIEGICIIKLITNIDDDIQAKNLALKKLQDMNGLYIEFDNKCFEDGYETYYINSIDSVNKYEMGEYTPDFNLEVIEPTFNELNQLKFNM